MAHFSPFAGSADGNPTKALKMKQELFLEVEQVCVATYTYVECLQRCKGTLNGHDHFAIIRIILWLAAKPRATVFGLVPVAAR
jgi:hypothetical protein